VFHASAAVLWSSGRAEPRKLPTDRYRPALGQRSPDLTGRGAGGQRRCLAKEGIRGSIRKRWRDGQRVRVAGQRGWRALEASTSALQASRAALHSSTGALLSSARALFTSWLALDPSGPALDSSRLALDSN
jgi:hypothetical protein